MTANYPSMKRESSNPWPEVNRRICEAWGLNPNDVMNIHISFTAHERPTAVVGLLLNEGVMKVILDLRVVGIDDKLA